jgi:hypothetical protein
MFSEPEMYLLDENDVIKKYKIPRSEALSSLSFNETVFGGHDQLNHDSTQRKLIAQFRGEFNHVVKKFATVEPAFYDKTERAIYTVERGSDGYDVIYAKPIVGRTNWDVMINLPRIIINDFTVGLSTAKFTYLYISAQLQRNTTYGESGKIGIYALSLSGNAALIVSGVPGWRQAPSEDSSGLSDDLPDFEEPPKNLIFNKHQGALYFSYRKALYRYKFSDMNLDLVRGFDGEITSLTLDSGWDKFVVIVGNQRVWFVNFNGQKAHQLHLHPNMPNITSVLTWEDQLIVADNVFYFTIFNKFTGMEFSDSKAMRMNFISNEGTMSKLKQIFSPESFRKSYFGSFSDKSLKFRGHAVYGEAPVNKTVPICPMNTFNIRHETSTASTFKKKPGEDASHCFCLGWEQMKPILTPKINASDYFNTEFQKCGVPECDFETIQRYAALRRAVPRYFVDDTLTKIGSGLGKVESVLGTVQVNGYSVSSTCYAGMHATYSKVDDSYWNQYKTRSYYPYGFYSSSRYSDMFAPRTSPPETKTNLEASDHIEYQCQRIGEYIPNKTISYEETYDGYLVAKTSTKTNTYHLMVDGAFIAEPGWASDFKTHETTGVPGYGSYSSYGPYARESNGEKIKREKAIGYVNSKYFGDKFTGKMCDNDAHLSLADMFFQEIGNCTASCQGRCEVVNKNMETAVNSKVTGNDTYKSIIDHIGKFYCKCEEGSTGRNCDITKVAPAAFVSGSGNGWLVGGMLIMVLVLIGLVVVVGFLRGYKTENPYFENQFAKMHYTDLEEDRDADFPDNSRKNEFNPFDTSDTQTVGNKNTKAANSEFDYNPADNEKGSLPNLVDMDACMGFNIPTNTSTWDSHTSSPDYTADTSGIVPDDQSSVKEESKQSKTVIKNPFYGANNKRGSTNSTEALVDI